VNELRISRLRRVDVLALIVAIYVVNYLATPAIVGEAKLEIYFRPRCNSRFDSDAWLRADRTTWKPGASVPYGWRYAMVDDLLRSKTLIGATERRVKELLGPPELTSDTNGVRSLDYFLATQRQYPARSILFPRLFANFDEWRLEVILRDGRVIMARIYFT
jgi:hypothetical protein